jgi:hypothetical protein
MGQANRQMIEREFVWDTTARIIVDGYRKYIGQRSESD